MSTDTDLQPLTKIYTCCSLYLNDISLTNIEKGFLFVNCFFLRIYACDALSLLVDYRHSYNNSADLLHEGILLSLILHPIPSYDHRTDICLL